MFITVEEHKYTYAYIPRNIYAKIYTYLYIHICWFLKLLFYWSACGAQRARMLL